MTPNLLIDHKPHDLGEPWSIAFPLDHDALIEVGGQATKLPAGAVLVCTVVSLDWYPASHPMRAAVRDTPPQLLDIEPGHVRLCFGTPELRQIAEEFERGPVPRP